MLIHYFRVSCIVSAGRPWCFACAALSGFAKVRAEEGFLINQHHAGSGTRQ